MITPLDAAENVRVEVVLRCKLSKRDASFNPQFTHTLANNLPDFGVHPKVIGRDRLRWKVPRQSQQRRLSPSEGCLLAHPIGA